MKHRNKYYSDWLAGIPANPEMLEGRGYRPDSRALFGKPGAGESVWCKTFSVGLDACCQEAYFLLGLLAADGRVKGAGAAVMYLEGRTGCGGFVVLPPETEQEDGDGEDAYFQPLMDVVPLEWMPAVRTPLCLEHEAEALKNGRFLPAGFEPAGFVLPRALSGCYVAGVREGEGADDLFLEDAGFHVTLEPDGRGFEGRFEFLADGGPRYATCAFSGTADPEGWRLDGLWVTAYPSTGTEMGNLFNRPMPLRDRPQDELQACLLLVDYCDGEEFGRLAAAPAGEQS